MKSILTNLILLLSFLGLGLSANADCTTCPAGQSEIIIYVWGDQWVDTEGSLGVTVGGVAVNVTNIRTGTVGDPVAFNGANITGNNEWWTFSLGCQTDGASVVVTYFDSASDGNDAALAESGELQIYSDGIILGEYDMSGCVASCSTPGDNVTNNCPLDNSTCADPGGNIALLSAGITTAPTDMDTQGGNNIFGRAIQEYNPYTQCATFTATATEMNMFLGGTSINEPNVGGCGYTGFNMELFDAACTSLASSTNVLDLNYASFIEGNTYILCGSYSYEDALATPDFPDTGCFPEEIHLGVSAAKCTNVSYWIGGSPAAGEGFGTCQNAVLTDTIGCYFDSGGPSGNYIPGGGAGSDRHVTNVCPGGACTVNITISYDLDPVTCIVGGDTDIDALYVFDGVSRDDYDGTLLTTLTGSGTYSFTSTGECFSIYSQPFCGDGTYSGFCVSWEPATTGCEFVWTPGDDCADPIILQPGDNASSNIDATSGPRYFEGQIIAGTSDACEPASTSTTGLCTTTYESTVYHQFTACSSGTISAQMIAEAGCPQDPQFSVWEITDTSDPCNNLSSIDCNASGGVISFTALAGTEYMLVVDGFAGAECLYNLELLGAICPTPTCPTMVEFGTEFNNLNDVEGTFVCENDVIALDASNADVIPSLSAANYGEFVSPGFRWIIEGDGFSGAETYTNIYSSGDPFTSDPADPADAVYGTGSVPDDGVGEFTRIHCSVDLSYTISICDVWGDGQIPYSIYDLNGNLVASGIADFDAIPGTGSNECIPVLVGSPAGTGGFFSGTGVTNTYSGDASYVNSSLGTFDASAVAASCTGTPVDITYTWNNENGCEGTQTQVVTVIQDITATQTGDLCDPTITQDCTNFEVSWTVSSDGPNNGATGTGFDGPTLDDGQESGTITYTITNPNAPAALAGSSCATLDVVVPFDCFFVPVELLSFEGKEDGRTNILNWVTVSETNNSHFMLQRSADGTRFSDIAKIEGNGTSSNRHDYNFVDQEPLTLSYYRLKQVDFDGTFEYSEVVSIQRRSDKFSIVSLFPNPTSDNIQLNYHVNKASKVNIQLTDVLGRVISSNTHSADKGINNYTIDMNAYAVGVYFVKLQNGGENIVRKIVKE